MSSVSQSQSRDKMRRGVSALNSIVVGYHDHMETIVCAMLAGGHVSGLGEPGTAKTLSMKALAWLFGDCRYHREQLVPDTMPADLLGTNVFIRETSKFRYRFGPLNPKVNFFHADEINRTTPKTQSALLQAMEEGQISTPRGVVSLNAVFMLLATRNPIDLEGTYPLPAAQLDRFAVELIYDRLTKNLELDVLRKTAFDRHGLDPQYKGILTIADIISAREELAGVHCSEGMMAYVEDLIFATRPGSLPQLENYFKAGVSVRAGQWMLRLGRARAYLHGRAFVSPDDIKYFAKPVLRHRLYLSEDKQLKRMNPDDAIQEIISLVPIVTQS